MSDTSERPAWRCATCKWARPHVMWWRDQGMTDQQADDEELPGEYGRRMVRFPMVCELAEFTKDEDGDQRRLCITIDGSNYMGNLYVKPDFGCIQWEAKDV